MEFDPVMPPETTLLVPMIPRVDKSVSSSVLSSNGSLVVSNGVTFVVPRRGPAGFDPVMPPGVTALVLPVFPRMDPVLPKVGKLVSLLLISSGALFVLPSRGPVVLPGKNSPAVVGNGIIVLGVEEGSPVLPNMLLGVISVVLTKEGTPAEGVIEIIVLLTGMPVLLNDEKDGNITVLTATEAAGLCNLVVAA